MTCRWNPGIHFSLSGLAARVFTQWAISLALIFVYLYINICERQLYMLIALLFGSFETLKPKNLSLDSQHPCENKLTARTCSPSMTGEPWVDWPALPASLWAQSSPRDTGHKLRWREAQRKMSASALAPCTLTMHPNQVFLLLWCVFHKEVMGRSGNSDLYIRVVCVQTVSRNYTFHSVLKRIHDGKVLGLLHLYISV